MAEPALPPPSAQSLTNHSPVTMPHRVPGIFPLLTLQTPTLSLHSHAQLPHSTNPHWHGGGDPSIALATDFYSLRLGRAQAETYSAKDDEEDNARCPQEPRMLQHLLQLLCRRASPQLLKSFAQFPSKRSHKADPSWLSASLTTRHEKHSSFSPGNAGKSLQHQRHHTRVLAPPFLPGTSAGAASLESTATSVAEAPTVLKTQF